MLSSDTKGNSFGSRCKDKGLTFVPINRFTLEFNLPPPNKIPGMIGHCVEIQTHVTFHKPQAKQQKSNEDKPAIQSVVVFSVITVCQDADHHDYQQQQQQQSMIAVFKLAVHKRKNKLQVSDTGGF